MATSEIKMTMSLATAAVTTALGKLKTGIANFATASMDKLNQLVKVVSVGLVAGFTAAAKSALEYGKEMQNLADVAGAGFVEFQKLAEGAKTVGIESDKLADIYKDVNDKVGDFLQAGSGPMVDFFENIAPAIGVTADQFKNLSGPQALQLYYDSIEKANLSQQEMTFYMEAIASDTTALIPLLANGGVAFKQFGEEAEEAGRIMELATAQSLASASKSIEEFKQKATIKVGELIAGEGEGAAIKQLGAQLMALAAEFGGWMINSFLTAGKEINVFFRAVAAKLGDELGDTFEFLGLKFMDAMAPTINHIREGLNALGMDIPLMDVAELQERMNTLLDKPSKDLTTYMSEFREQIGPVNISVDEQAQYWRDIANEQGSILTKEQALRKATQATIDVVKILYKTKESGESIISVAMTNQLALAEAMASGDQDAIQHAKEQISKEEQINKLIKEAGVSRARAVELVEQQNAKLDEQADLRRELLDAQLAGDDIAIRAAEQKIQLEEKALQIMKDTNTSYTEAIILAEKWLIMMAGADLNNSGFTTTFEQREYDKIMAERQQVLDDALAAEEREQREQGGNIENVSAERAETGSVWDRAAADKEARLRRAENDRLNRIRDPEERAKELAQIEQDREQRRLEQLVEDFNKENEERLGPDGQPMDEKGNQIGPDGVLRDPQGNAVDPNGNVIPEPKKPQTLDDVIDKMDKIHTTIKSIDKSLKCEP